MKLAMYALSVMFDQDLREMAKQIQPVLSYLEQCIADTV